MKQRRWSLAGGGCLLLFFGLLAAGMAAYQFVAYVPPIPLPVPDVLPNNAKDDFLAAIQLIPADSDASPTGPRSADVRPGSPSYLSTPALRDLIRRSQPALRRFRQGLPQEFRANPDPATPADTLGYRRLGRLLSYEGDLALREGRPDDALRIGVEIARLGNKISQGGALLEAIVGTGVVLIGRKPLELAVPSASPRALKWAAKELYELDRSTPTYQENLRVERRVAPAAFARELRARRPEGEVQELWKSSWEDREFPRQDKLLDALTALTTPRRTILAEYLRNLDLEIVRAGKPYQSRGALPPEPSNPVIRDALAFRNDFLLYGATRAVALRRVLATQLAVHAYTRKQGHPPASLATLVPQYLLAVPEDPFASAPLLYRIVKGQPFVYSRGPDGDDDGGKDLGGHLTPDGDGDLASMRRK